MPGDAAAERSPAGRKWKIIAIILLVLILAPASLLARRGATRMEYFHLRKIEVRGTRYLKPEAVVEKLAVDTMRSVWDDTAPLAARVLSMEQVAAVEITRELPGTLVVEIRERVPVAFAHSSRGLEVVDSAGTVLPIDPSAEQLDLPIAHHRDLSLLTMLSQARARLPLLYERISEASRDGKSDVVLHLASAAAASSAQRLTVTDSVAPAHPQPSLLRVRAPLGVSVTRLADIFPVESDLLRRRAHVAELDLRYRDQVIARLQ